MEWTTLVTDCDMLLQEEGNYWNGRKQISLSDAFFELLHYRLSCEELLILTERQETLDLANRMRIPVVGLERDDAIPLTGTSYILQEIDMESVFFLEQVYLRYYDLSVIIAETKHLFIREMKKSDTEELFRLYQCRDVQKEVAQGGLSREELALFLESYSRMRYPLYEYGMWVLEEKNTGRLVGEAGIEEDTYFDWGGIKGDKICLEVGYVICPEFRRRGYATEALNGILAYVKEKKEVYQFDRVSCYIRIGNLASARTAIRCGFVRSEDGRYGEGRDLEQYCFRL